MPRSGSPTTPRTGYLSRLGHLDGRMQVAGVLLGDEHDALDQPAVDPCSQLDGGPVRAHDDRVAGRDAAALGVSCGELDVLARPLELELGNAFHGRAREQWRVAL